MHQEKLKELLDKHRNKQASPEEEILLQAWTEEVNRRSQHQEIFSTESEEKMLGLKIWAQINPGVPLKSKRHKIGQLLRYAALMGGIFLTGWFYVYYHNKSGPLNEGGTAILWDTVSAAPQTIKQLVLKDGSEIYLNAGSVLRYPKQANARKREVELLSGEARFAVAHDVKRPFTVSCRGIKTRVLGTQFTVSAYGGMPDIKVNVHSGKVAVSYKEKLLAQLLNGEGLVYNIDQRLASKNTGIEDGFDPLRQSCFLKNAPFEELAIRIRNTYGYELKTNKQSIKESHFTGELNFKEPISLTMHNFSRIYGGTFSIKGREVLMY